MRYTSFSWSAVEALFLPLGSFQTKGALPVQISVQSRTLCPWNRPPFGLNWLRVEMKPQIPAGTAALLTCSPPDPWLGLRSFVVSGVCHQLALDSEPEGGFARTAPSIVTQKNPQHPFLEKVHSLLASSAQISPFALTLGYLSASNYWYFTSPDKVKLLSQGTVTQGWESPVPGEL